MNNKMENTKQLPRRYILVGHLCLIVLLFLAAWFVEERVLLIDSAYQLFHDINHEGILINDNRFSMVLSQMLPWLLIKLHVPLRWIIVAYSVGFVAIAYGCFLLTAYWLKDHKAALLMVFTLLAMNATFFHCISETFQLMFFAPLLYALISSEKRGILYWIALVLTVAAAFFIHPIALFFIVFIIVFHLLDKERFTIDAPTVIVTLLLIVCVVVKVLAGQSGHDASFIPTAETLSNALRNFFHLNSIKFFYAHFWGFYLFPILLWLMTIKGYTHTHRWLKLTFVTLFVLGFFALSVVVYWEGDGPIGMERSYLPLVFFIGLPFLRDELPRLCRWQETVFFIILAALLAVSLTSVALRARPYSNRLAEIGKIAVQARAEGQRKLIVTRSTAEQIFPVNIWGLALESALYTARDGADQCVTIYMEEDDFDRADTDLYDNPDVFVSVNWWKRWEIKELNPHYFKLPPQGYKELVRDGDNYLFKDL